MVHWDGTVRQGRAAVSSSKSIISRHHLFQVQVSGSQTALLDSREQNLFGDLPRSVVAERHSLWTKTWHDKLGPPPRTFSLPNEAKDTVSNCFLGCRERKCKSLSGAQKTEHRVWRQPLDWDSKRVNGNGKIVADGPIFHGTGVQTESGLLWLAFCHTNRA